MERAKGPGMLRTVSFLLVTALLVLSVSACAAGNRGTAQKPGGQTPDARQEPGDTRHEEQPGAGKGKAAAEITQTSLLTWEDSIDNIWAHGAIEITNTGDVPVKTGDISISFVASDDSILGTASMILPVPEIIMPGEKAYAGDSTIIEGIDDPTEITSIEANIDFDETDGKPQILDVRDLKIIVTDIGRVKVTGRVVNNSPDSADDIRIIVAAFDEDDRLLGIYTDSPDVTLAPGKNMGFETSYPVIRSREFADKVKKLVGKAYNWKFDF